MRTLLPLSLVLLLSCREEGDPKYASDADKDGVSSDQDCNDQNPTVGAPATWYDDADGDGWGAEGGDATCAPSAGAVASAGDCDDADPDVSPGANERCDGADQDCDGVVDNGLELIVSYTDADGDGYGDDASAAESCAPPAGTVDEGGDCDDADPARHPSADEPDCTDPNDYNCDGSAGYADADGDGWAACEDCDDALGEISPSAAEICDGLDNDCDGLVDLDDSDLPATGLWYTDADADGYGDDASGAAACEAPPGSVAVGGDCDDADASFNPGASEADCADPNDYNCDGSVGYADLDADGQPACTDCDDSDPSVSPLAEERCDGRDEDCDGTIDNDPIDASTWYADADGDGSGDADVAVVACESPASHVADSGDCDDLDADTFPGAAERCDGADNDCDGTIDEDIVSRWYADADGDGFGDGASASDVCDPPSGYVADDTDCNDLLADTFPGATEICDSVDNDCDGVADDSVGVPWFRDADGDGFGGTDTTESCEAPPGYTATPGDCDDTDGATSPAGTEVCDDADNDCDTSVDEDTLLTWYLDADTDGFGIVDATIEGCEAPGGYVGNTDDCDDASASVSPNAVEICDTIDNDCDGSVDESGVGIDAYYADTDGDGYGDPGVRASGCSAPAGYVPNDGDCDDGAGAVSPDAAEACDGIDNDCDGEADEASAVDASTFYADNDDDGHGGRVTVRACEAPTGFSTVGDDCDDGEAEAYPGATEICDSLDNDCDGDADGGLTSSFYEDTDGDGFGNPADTLDSCTAPAGYVAASTDPGDQDCDDLDADIHPDATEVCDGFDNDCDGDADGELLVTLYDDLDGDGFGDPNHATESCLPPASQVPAPADPLDVDCDDLDADVHPDAAELCDGLDNNCDGVADEGLSTTWYLDYDRDGYGDDDDAESACAAPSARYVAGGGDCDDTDGARHPGAAPGCDGGDLDCDGLVDNDADEDGYADILCGGDDCDDTNAAIYPDVGGGCALGISCLDILDGGYDDGDGLYTIDPDGYGTGEDPVEVYCDMTTEGGGWTMVANLSDSDSDSWSQFMPAQDAGLWDSVATLGSAVSFTADYKSPAYITVPATSLLIKEGTVNNVLFAESCWPEQTFLDFISGLSWSGTGSDSNWSDSSGAWLCNFEHYGYTDPVLRAGGVSGSERVVGFKWGEANGAQDGNKDRTMITTYRANGYSTPHHIDLPTGLGGFTAYGSSENYEDANECQGDGPERCGAHTDQNYQLLVR